MTPRQHATVDQKTSQVDELIWAGPNVSARGQTKYSNGAICNYTPFKHAVTNGRMDLCQLLVGNGCDLTARHYAVGSSFRYKALDITIKNNALDCVHRVTKTPTHSEVP